MVWILAIRHLYSLSFQTLFWILIIILSEYFSKAVQLAQSRYSYILWLFSLNQADTNCLSSALFHQYLVYW